MSGATRLLALDLGVCRGEQPLCREMVSPPCRLNTRIPYAVVVTFLWRTFGSILWVQATIAGLR